MRASLEKIRGSLRNSAMSRRFSFEIGEITQGSRERFLGVTWCFVGSQPNSLEWLRSWLGFWAEAWCSSQAVGTFRMPEIGYGSLLRMRGRVAARISLRLADRVLSFSDWSADAIRRLVPRSNVHRVYLGVDTDRFRPSRKENLVVSVAHVSRENLARKGLVTFVKAASLVPDAHFC